MDRIVRRLDGLPLALELAAAKARTLTLAEIDAGLDDRFALLASGPRAADPRHQTLRALIDWSWETLGDAERAALLAASVFADGIGAADTAADAFDTDAAAFDLLVDRSRLVRADGRYRMLETVREYGVDRLRRDGREQAARVWAAQMLATLARTQDARLRGPEARAALAWYDANDESLSAARRLTLTDPALRELGVAIARHRVAGVHARALRRDRHRRDGVRPRRGRAGQRGADGSRCAAHHRADLRRPRRRDAHGCRGRTLRAARRLDGSCPRHPS